MTGAVAKRTRRVAGTSLRMSGDATVQLSVNPLVSLLSTVADSLGGPAQGTPQEVRAAVRRAVTRPDVLRPLFAPDTVSIPDCLVPLGRPGQVPIAEQFDLIRSVRPDLLVTELELTYLGHPPESWRPVLAQPGRWLSAYADALGEAWSATERIWARAKNLLSLETERVGAAVVTDAVDLLLGSLSSRFSYADGALTLPDRHPTVIDLGGRPLVLVPMVSGLRASVFNADLPDMVWVGYPVPAIGSVWERQPVIGQTDDPLNTVVGSVRAILLRALSAPMTMSDAAALASCSATTMTHHCQYLERAGLIHRRRWQRSVMIHRSARGDNLVEIFAR
ncbi:winged helix-turn-helix domain-containing protein [Fodinicola acaciae]|uniref:winged helix-turn-helix domain-containing protein n=1 Tax=Fodinicola acaciae TaxID=2681555 RepID=UPI0013D2B10D|nr:helix-turn-helix domain-containing protein [Fodinicola acaciae]